MDYYYIPTSTLNLNNILSTESISPECFYKNRNFGYKRFSKVSPNPFSNTLIAYNRIPLFEIDESEYDNYPLIVEVSRELLPDSAINQSIEVNGLNILQVNNTIYLHPQKSRFLFFSHKDIKTSLIKVEPSIETKLLPIYSSNFHLITKDNRCFDWKQDILSNLTDIPSDTQLINIEIDSKINRLKGFYYSYFLGIILSTSSKNIPLKEEYLIALNSIINSLNSTKKSYDLKDIDNLFNLKSRVDESEGNKKVPLDELIDAIYIEDSGIKERDKLIEFLKKTKSGKYTFYSQLEWNIEQRIPINHINLLIDNIIDALKEAYSKELISKKSSRILKYISELKHEEKNPINPLLVVENIIFNAYKVTQLSDEIFKKRGSELYQNIINEILEYPINNSQDFFEERIELAIKIGDVLKEYIENWEDSNERQYLNRLLDNIEKYAPFEIKSHNSIILQSIAIFILKGDDPEKLLSALIQNRIDDYRLALGLWGAIFGFSALPKTITNLLFTEKYVEVTKIFYQDVQKKIHNCFSSDELHFNLIPQKEEAIRKSEITIDHTKQERISKQNNESYSEASLKREETPKCPKCGADTILKESKFGKFYGCTRYNKTGCDGKVNFKDIPAKKESEMGLSKIIIDYVSKNKYCKITDLIPIIKEKTNIARNVSNIESYIRDYLSAELELEKIDKSKGVKMRGKGIFG